MSKSQSTTSGEFSRASLRPTSPSSASMTRHPRVASHWASVLRSARSSSMSKTVFNPVSGGSVSFLKKKTSAYGYSCAVRSGRGRRRCAGVNSGQQLQQGRRVRRQKSDARPALDQSVGLENFEQGLGHFLVARDRLQRVAHDLRAHRAGLGKLNGRLALGRARDDADLVGPVLFDGRRDLAQTIHHLALDLPDHFGVAKMDFANIDRAEFVTPLMRLRRNFRPHRLAHGVAIGQHAVQRHVAQATHGRIAHVGRERPARIGVFKQIRNRIADEHFVPDSDAHGRALLGIDRLAAEIFLVEPHVNDMTGSKQIYDQRARPELGPQKMQAGFIDGSQHFSEQDINMATALADDDIKSNQPQQAEENRLDDEHRHEGDHGSDGKVSHGWDSLKTWGESWNKARRTLRTYSGKVFAPDFFNASSWAANRCNGSISACAFNVSISTARRDCTIFWSAAARARLMSDETWLWAVLMAASADSTSGGGSMPVINEASSAMP